MPYRALSNRRTNFWLGHCRKLNVIGLGALVPGLVGLPQELRRASGWPASELRWGKAGDERLWLELLPVRSLLHLSDCALCGTSALPEGRILVGMGRTDDVEAVDHMVKLTERLWINLPPAGL